MRSIIELIDALDVRKRILIIGSAFVDVIVHVPRLPLSGEDVEGSSRQQVVGGCAYNAADAVAKLGIDFDALIPVGEGMIADRVRETFRARGFTVREFRGIGDNGWCLSFVEPDGERTFVSMSGVEKCFKPEWLDEIDLQCADLIYLSGYQRTPAMPVSLKRSSQRSAPMLRFSLTRALAREAFLKRCFRPFFQPTPF